MGIWTRNAVVSLQFCDLWTGTPRKFGDLRFADLSLQIYGFAICGRAHLRNLRICDCGMSQRICGFEIYEQTKNCVPTFACLCFVILTFYFKYPFLLVSIAILSCTPVSDPFQIISTVTISCEPISYLILLVQQYVILFLQ
jgi:hypothetical protein